MSSLTREKRHVNAGQLFAEVLQESHEWLLRLIGLRMTLLLSKAIDELLARERYERRGSVPPAPLRPRGRRARPVRGDPGGRGARAGRDEAVRLPPRAGEGRA